MCLRLLKENWLIVIVIILGICIDIYILKSQIALPTIKNSESFIDKNESLYDLMEKEAEISTDVYMKKIRDADVIQSNPWIMIDSMTKNATIHPRDVLDKLTGQNTTSLSWHPRNYYEYSDVLYTGLPL